MINFEKAKSTMVSSPQYDGMPKADGYGNKVETKVIKSIDKVRYYEKKCEWIEDTIVAISQIDEDEELLAKLLKYRYLHGNDTLKVSYLLAQDIHKMKPNEFDFDILPETSYRRLHNNALLTFAELYASGELLVLNK